MKKPIPCPQCGQSDQVEKVSAVYIAAIEKQKQKDPSRRGLARLLPPEENLARRLTPPSGGKALPTRPLHPDMVAGALALVTPIFLYNIYHSQPAMFWPMALFTLAVGALFLSQRRAIVAKFQRQQAEKQAAAQRVQSAVERWLKLYYCARDDAVFEPGSSQATPADQMPGLLLKG